MGLRRGVARKQFRWEAQRSGPELRREEKHEPTKFASTATGNATLITVPPTSKQTLTQVSYRFVASSPGTYYIDLDDVGVFNVYVTVGNEIVGTFTWRYDEAPTAVATIKQRLAGGLVLTTAQVSVLYVQETAAEGWLTEPPL